MNLEQLITARRKKKFVSIEDFNIELVEALKINDVFATGEYKGKPTDNYETFYGLITQEYDITDKQKKLYNFILMSDIMSWLDDVIDGSKEVVEGQPIKENPAADKTYLHCSTCECEPTDAPNISPTFDVNDISDEDLPF